MVRLDGATKFLATRPLSEAGRSLFPVTSWKSRRQRLPFSGVSDSKRLEPTDRTVLALVNRAERPLVSQCVTAQQSFGIHLN